MAEFLLNNRLKLNDDKTHLLVMTTSQFRRKNPNLQVEIRTPTEIISASESEKLLGGIVHQNLKWSEHILNGEGALIKALTTRLGALNIIGRVSNFKNRKRLLKV